MSGVIFLADNGMGMNERLVILQRHIARERQKFELLITCDGRLILLG